MTAALAVAGWALAAVLLAILRRRLELVARAEHELRGPVTVLGLAVREPALELQLDRMRAGLADLSAARRGRRAPSDATGLALEDAARAVVAGWRPVFAARGRRVNVDWDAGRARIVADRGRLAQALGNLVANAAEHGDGPVELRGRRTARGVRVEVENRSLSGRGLKIATDAARDAGGELRFARQEDRAIAALDLPVADPPESPAA